MGRSGLHREPSRGVGAGFGADAGLVGAVSEHGAGNSAAGRLITRRSFLKGAGALAAGLVVSSSLSTTGCGSSSSSDSTGLMVTSDQLVTLDDFELVDTDGRLSNDAIYELPAGTLAWMASDIAAVTLLPADTTRPLSQVGLFNIGTGNSAVVLENPIGESEGYDIYEVRGSSTLLLWTEVDYMTNNWRVYMAPLSGTDGIGSAQQLDEGDSDWDPPLLCVDGKRAVWTVMPNEDGNHSSDDSLVRTIVLGDDSPSVLYTSHGRLVAMPERSDGFVTIVPRADTSSGIYYQPTAIDSSTGEVVASFMLPKGVKTIDALYMQGAFSWLIEATYDSTSVISQVGTYRDLGDGTYFRLNKQPTCISAYCEPYTIVKNGKNTTVIDFSTRQYFTIEAPQHSTSYGDYTASSGTSKRLVTYCTTSDSTTGDQAVMLRVFSLT